MRRKEFNIPYGMEDPIYIFFEPYLHFLFDNERVSSRLPVVQVQSFYLERLVFTRMGEILQDAASDNASPTNCKTRDTARRLKIEVVVETRKKSPLLANGRDKRIYGPTTTHTRMHTRSPC